MLLKGHPNDSLKQTTYSEEVGQARIALLDDLSRTDKPVDSSIHMRKWLASILSEARDETGAAVFRSPPTVVSQASPVAILGQASLTQGGCDGSGARYTTAKLSEGVPPSERRPRCRSHPHVAAPLRDSSPLQPCVRSSSTQRKSGN